MYFCIDNNPVNNIPIEMSVLDSFFVKKRKEKKRKKCHYHSDSVLFTIPFFSKFINLR